LHCETWLTLSTGKRKRDEDREKEEQLHNGISKYFSANPIAVASKQKVSIATSFLTELRR